MNVQNRLTVWAYTCTVIIINFHVMTTSCRVLTHRSKKVKMRTASSDYILENPQAIPHGATALDIDKPNESINLQPMHEENSYIQWQPEWASPTNL